MGTARRLQIGFSMAALFTLQCCGGRAPTDDEMIGVFKTKKIVFETLRSELCALPHAQTVWLDSDPTPTLARGDLSHYRDLLSQIGATRVSAIPSSSYKDRLGEHSCFVDVTDWSDGILDSGNSKDWFFGHGPMSRDDLALKSLNDIDFKNTVNRFPSPSQHGHRTYWRQLNGGWWIQFDHWE